MIENHLHSGSQKVQIAFMCDINEGTLEALDETEEVAQFDIEEAQKMQLTPKTLNRMKIVYSMK